MRPGRVLVVGTVALLASCDGCGVGTLDSLVPVIAPSSTDVEFGEVFVGFVGDGTLTLTNVGSAPLTVSEIVVEGEGFSIPGEAVQPTVVGVDASFGLDLHFSPTSAGSFTGQLLITSDAVNRPVLGVRLAGEGVMAPACDDGNPCTDNRFDPEEGNCVTTALSDVSCGEGDACLTDGVCINGSCVGNPVACPPPASPCRIGLCDADVGCMEVDNPTACDDEDPCTIDSCDAATGCSHAPVDDGTPCGPFGGCESLPLCVGGVCTSAPVPDGTPCIDGNACTVGDQCQGGACEGAWQDTAVASLGVARNFGAVGGDVIALAEEAIVLPEGNERFVFFDQAFGEAWLTVVDVADGELSVRSQLVLDDDKARVLVPAPPPFVFGLHMTATAVEVEQFLVGPMGAIVPQGQPIAIAPAAVDGEVIDRGRRVTGVATEAHAYVCAEQFPNLLVLDADPSGPSLVAPMNLLGGHSCADVAIAPDGDVVVAIQQYRFEGIDSGPPGPGLVARWEETAASPPLSLVASHVFGADVCSGPSEQPLLVAVPDDGFAYVGCGTGLIGTSPRRAGTLVRLPADLATAEEVSMGTTPDGAQAFSAAKEMVSAGDDLWMLTWGALGDALCARAATGAASCAPPKLQSGDVSSTAEQTVFALSSSVAAFGVDNGLYLMERVGLVQISGAWHGSFGLLLPAPGGVVSASRHATHRVALSTQGPVVDEGRVEPTDGIRGYALVGFGLGGGPPLQVVGSSVSTLYDTSSPGAPVSTGRSASLFGPLTSTGERVVGLVNSTGGIDIWATWLADTANGFALAQTTLGLEAAGPVDDGRLIRGADGRALGLIPLGSSASAIAIVDVSAEGTPVPISINERDHPRPVDGALADDSVLVARGTVIAFDAYESPSEDGALMLWRLQDGALPDNGPVTMALPGVSDILSFDGGLALVAVGSTLHWVVMEAEGMVVLDTVDLGGPITDAAISDDVLFVSSPSAVKAFSPPCPPPLPGPP